MRRSICFLFLFMSVLAAGVEGGPGKAEFARLVSRDSKMFLWTDDRAALARRFRRVEAFSALAAVLPESGRRGLLAAGADLSVFLTPEILGAIPDLLAKGSGDLAVSVEGYVLADGKALPDMLLVADVDGYEGVVEELAALAARRDLAAGEPVLSRLPFRLGSKQPVKAHAHRGVTIVQVETAGGHSLALAESDGVLYGARSSQRVEMALDRSLRRQIGSLADSARFQHAVRRVTPDSGSFCCYADLRRLRDQRTVHLLPEGAGRNLLVDALDAYDGLCFTLRGHGGHVELRAFLERGPGTIQSVPAVISGANSIPRALQLLPANSVACLTLRVGARSAGDLLASLNPRVGGTWSPRVLEEYLRALMGAEAAAGLEAKLGQELTLVVPRGPRTGEVLPRIVFLLETGDPGGLESLLNGVAANSSPASCRRLDLSGETIYQVALPRNGYVTELALAVRNGFLIGTSKVVYLREFLNDCASRAPGLIAAESFLRPLDLLDRPATTPTSTLLFLDSPTMAMAALGWLPACLQPFLKGRRDPEAVDALMHLLVAFTDFDFTESLRGVLITSRSVADGLLIEGVGP